jgi:hypothetical protein
MPLTFLAQMHALIKHFHHKPFMHSYCVQQDCKIAIISETKSDDELRLIFKVGASKLSHSVL